MAISHKTHHLITVVVLILFIFTSNSLSSARLLNDFSHGLAATEPTLNLALPLDDVNDVFDKSEQDPKPQVLPCDYMVPIKNSHMGILRSPTPRVGRKYGSMILNMLPKGQVPSSGPSKGSNDVKN